MTFFGPISSVFDLATFGVMLRVFHAGESLFQTGWFVESLLTQTLIIHIIRTNRLSLPQALPLVTGNVARVLGIDDRKGSLAPGQDADVVLLTEDLMVDTVIARGRIMVRDGHAVVRGPFEERDAFDYGL